MHWPSNLKSRLQLAPLQLWVNARRTVVKNWRTSDKSQSVSRTTQLHWTTDGRHHGTCWNATNFKAISLACPRQNQSERLDVPTHGKHKTQRQYNTTGQEPGICPRWFQYVGTRRTHVCESPRSCQTQKARRQKMVPHWYQRNDNITNSRPRQT